MAVFRLAARHRAIDLATVRETLLYMKDDLEQAPGLDRVAEALRAALAEIDRVEADAAAGRSGQGYAVNASLTAPAARFIRWRRS